MSDSNATEMKRCPFCGGEPYYYAPGPAEHHIQCVQCHAETDGWIEKEQAIEAWNTRAERTCKPEEVYLDDYSDLTATVCSNCRVAIDDLEDCYYCPNCGAKVVDA